MALSVDPATYVISIPKADLTLIQSVPTEIRELDTNAFRLELKAWEDDQDIGIYLYKTHTHNTEVTLGGLTYARVIEILDPYTITFEDDQYAVNITGSNNNIADKVNVNQVSVRSANSAGLISSPAIEFSSYNGGVIIDEVNGFSGTIFPRGTEQMPSSNLDDALLIADYRGFKRLYLHSDIDLDGGSDISEFHIVGRSHVFINVELLTNLDCIGTKFEDCNIFGVLDGANELNQCVIGDLTFFNGHIHNCSLSGTITLDGSEDAYISNCSRLDINIIPVINMGGSGQDLVMPNYSGAIWIENLTGSNKIGIGLDAGKVILDSATVTAGNVTVSGVGELVDETGDIIESGTWNGVTILNNTLSPVHLTNHIWDEQYASHGLTGSFGEAIDDLLSAGGSLTPTQAQQLTDILASVDSKLLTKALWLALKS